MSDDEGGRLLIDDIHDVSGSTDNIIFTPVAFSFENSSDEGKIGTSTKKLPVSGQSRLTPANSICGTTQSLPENMDSDLVVSENLVGDQSKEEGELEDDDVDVLVNTEDTSRRNSVRQKYVKNGIALNYTKFRSDNTKKRKENEGDRNDGTTSAAKTEGISAKKHKPSVRDRGTCVHSRAIQSDVDDSLFDMEVGSSALVEMTVVCKLDCNNSVCSALQLHCFERIISANALYVVAKWKDQELSGILTDGQPPAFNTYMKKRKSMHTCPFDSCQHRYEKGAELDYHKVSAHGKRAVMSESICCQTDFSLFNPKSVYTDVEGLETYAMQRENVEELVKTATSSSLTIEVKKEQDVDLRSPGGFSDISDDGGAPQLQKLLVLDGNATTKDNRPSSLPVAAATPAAQPSSFQPISGDRPRTHANRASPSVVHPFSSSTIPVSISSSPRGSGFMSTAYPHQVIHFPSPISASVRTAPSPARLVADQHKISHKSNDVCTSSADSASTSAASGVVSASKTMPSPANSVQRAFGMPMMQQSGT
uniref:C2H2-type domain-containing protein n=1 Tax=Heterorhabditis bacteriophora TaxID=37862 RepID=A0A1I7XP24_HETBA